jgi:hypothetical protein
VLLCFPMLLNPVSVLLSQDMSLQTWSVEKSTGIGFEVHYKPTGTGDVPAIWVRVSNRIRCLLT